MNAMIGHRRLFSVVYWMHASIISTYFAFHTFCIPFKMSAEGDDKRRPRRNWTSLLVFYDRAPTDEERVGP